MFFKLRMTMINISQFPPKPSIGNVSNLIVYFNTLKNSVILKSAKHFAGKMQI